MHLLLGFVFNITLLLVEYKHYAFAQSFSLGYKPVRPSYFAPEHAGHHVGQLIPPGPPLPAGPATTAAPPQPTAVLNRNPSKPNDTPPEMPVINHWFRPVIITNGVTGAPTADVRTTVTLTTQVIATSTSTVAPVSVPSSVSPGSAVTPQFLPEGDLFTSAPAHRPFPPVSDNVNMKNELDQPTASNVTVTDLLPLFDQTSNKSSAVESLNLLLPVLPLRNAVHEKNNNS